MKLVESKFFALIAAILITTQLLAACASATPVSTQEPTQLPPPSPTMMPMPASTESASGIDPLVFQQAVRKLWEDHITWTRLYIISAAAGLPDSDAAAGRLLQNQVDIGNAIKPFYGDPAGEQLTSLLKEHITTAVDLLNAAKSGDNTKLEDAKKRWYDNADQIATFLNQANPDNWPLSDLQSMMKSHLDLTLEEATARLNGDWAGDAAAYDKVHNEILEMADSLAQGIIKQFPDKFAEQTASQKEIDLTLAMNKLWEDHITWTRLYIISFAAGLPDADTAAGRLLQNQVDIGDAIKPVYGDEAGNQLTSLLKEHITTAVDLLNAAKSGDNTKLEDAKKRWYDNADQIATFLNQANPDNWPLSDLQSMMKSHLDLTLEEATARLNGDWADDAAAYDKVHNEILEMADSLAQGIIKQFPDKLAEQTASQKEIDLTLAMNKLWEDHITWTRLYIISFAAGLPDADTAAGRLLQNQVDIGDAIKPVYGDEAGNQLTSLLKEHITTAVDLLNAAKSGDNTKLEDAKKRWYDNADQIATFLNQANPDNWPLSDLQSMMKSHLDLTLEEATARLNGDWAGDAAAYDKVHNEILEMADSLAQGIIKQFPDKFAEQTASQKEIDLTLAMNKLWEDHITWTRLYIISFAAGLPDADTAAGRLLQNQVDIGDAIKPVYGDEAGNQLTSLLKEHITTAVDLLNAAKSGDNTKLEDAKKRWYDNADQIATFLNQANPDNWPLSDLQSMMKSHLDLTLEEATARLNGDWAGDAAAYDKVHNEILEMADSLAQGIIKQFPDKFAEQTASQKEIDLTLAMNKLWEDHITWTRLYIISFAAGLPDADTAAGRLLQNQVDIGDAIKPVYGDEAGNQLTSLLKEHITTAVDLLNAAKSGDNTKLEDAKKRWYDNADQIAAFLNQANPDNWPLSDLQSMMKSHLDLTLEETTARLNGDWADDAAAYDKVHNEILEMADSLAQGIIKQFPDKLAEQTASQKEIDLTLAMNKLWEDHITWTRLYIISFAAGLPDADTAAGRLLQNQVDIGDAIKPVYGDEAGNQLTSLLKEHITTAVDLLNAAKSGDNTKLEDAKKRWYDNADQIATFLNQANPDNWPLSDLQSMMKSHLDLTLEEATARLNGDWAGDAAAYDKVHNEILEMADSLAQGIIKQFPDKFAEQTASQKEIDLTLAMNKLWEDHITWTRLYIISFAAGLPDADTAAGRLLQNQVDIGDAIKPVYGDEAGNQLTSLLKEHITTAVDLLNAAKSGDNTKLEDAKKRWYDNADQIATFLNQANPDNWPLSDLQSMMKSHLDLTLEEATARLNGDWAGDAAAYDKVHNEILEMADSLAQGIIKQFPDKFAEQTASQKEIDLTLAMNKLWEDHITWTRLYIISFAAGLPDADTAAGRLLQNQVDIGDAIKPVYGDEAGNQLTSLLKEHITTAVDLLNAAKSGDNTKLEDAKKRWYDNADQIATFLNQANPDNWPLSDLQSMMKSHLDLTLEEATARLNGDWAGDAAAYDKVHNEILEMADSLAQGIIKQFPDKFAEQTASQKEIDLTLAMNKLWEDHITWTRLYIISFAAGLPDADTAAGRLLQNQVDIGDAIKPVYGDEAGNQLTSLLKEHITTAVDLLNAAKSGDNTKLEDAKKRWYDNADQIAAFLNQANPDNWPLSDLQSMMKSHLDLTLEETTARLNGDWADDAAAYDKVHNEILEMADSLAQGIIKQFPDKLAEQTASQKEIDLTLAMNKLWEDHITWTRLYIISFAAGLPDADTAAGRLLQNQVDIGDAIKPVYGDEAGNQLTSLLKEHITTAVDLLNAAKSGDNTKLEDAKKRWYDNADQIATFLNQANPDNWPLSDLQSMMKSHLDLTLEEATARLNGDWAGDAAAYDKVHNEILEMADSLAQGIIKQFPDKFAEQTASQKEIDLTLAMNKLWEDHITWTRLYIISFAAGLPDADTAAGRLLQNQVDIGDAIKPVYGDEAGNQLTSLLKEHITTAVDLLNAAKSGDNTKLEDAKKRWYDNADQIATFLNQANPDNWPLSDLQSMMKSHLDLTLEEATARLNGDWAGDAAAYDKVHNEILEMADSLAQGIIKQFPDKFAEQTASQKEIDLTLAMNKLWEDHITWTRLYIISFAAGLPDADTAAGRLLQNQVDIGDAIKPVYGDEAGNQLTSLLKEHITTAVDLLNAAKSGDNTKLEDAKKRWYDNADQIATFLNQANPDNWPLSDLQSMMKSHLDLTLEEATARLNGDWAGDAAAYDKVHNEILEMADSLAQGIIKQFPDKFAEQTASQKEIDLTLAMNKLWEDHITWTRLYIISFAAGLPDADTAAGRLLQNQVDIGDAIKPVYGDEAGNQLTSLLKEHITTAVDLLNAAKSGDNT